MIYAVAILSPIIVAIALGFILEKVRGVRRGGDGPDIGQDPGGGPIGF